MKETDLYYLWLDDKQQGPFTVDQLRSMWSAGKITVETKYCQAGWVDWEKLDLISGLLVNQQSQPVQIVAAPTASSKQRHPITTALRAIFGGVMLLFLIVFIITICVAPQGTYDRNRISKNEDLIYKFLGDKLIEAEVKGWLRIEASTRKAWIDPDYWTSFNATAKENVTTASAVKCAVQIGSSFARVTMLDRQSGRVLATYADGIFTVK